jgi:hypothetical protein
MCDPVTMATLATIGSTTAIGTETVAAIGTATELASVAQGVGAAAQIGGGASLLAPAAPLLAPAAPAAFAMPSLVKPAFAASSIMSAFQQRNAGISQDYAYKQQAAQEGIKAREEGIIRREKLLNTLALQGARTGASGITGMTPKSIALTDIQNFRDEQQMADLGSKASQKNSRSLGSNARRGGRMGAATSLIDGYVKMRDVG